MSKYVNLETLKMGNIMETTQLDVEKKVVKELEKTGF